MLKQAAKTIKSANRVTAFTGAGISVESGIPPFRGANGLWNKVDPKFIEIGYFHTHTTRSWQLIREIFYDFFGKAVPNAAHYGLAKLEEHGLLKTVITQNIDNLHQDAGNTNVLEFHGTASYMVCLDCHKKFPAKEIDLETIPPKCPNCEEGLLKPDFVFFGEGIPEPASSLSFKEAELSDVFIVIGTTGEVMPACMIPMIAKENGATIIEINPSKSAFTDKITDIHLQGLATEMVDGLIQELNLK
jgi:NAD-dependent deacetylase